MRPFKLSKPFQNLSIPQSILQKARLLFSSLALVFLVVVLVIPYLDSKIFYCARINCTREDLSEALYNSLRTSVTSTEGDTPVDATLTNSQVIALTDYTESLYASAPQFTINSLWRWCSGNYIQEEVIDKYGQVTHKHVNETLTCYDYHPSQNQSIFDYVGQLQAIGLESIMAYAYSDDVDNATKEAGYHERVYQRGRAFKLVNPAIGFSAILQGIIIIFTLILYSSRFQKADDHQYADLESVPRFLLHIITVISCVAFLSGSIGASIITRIMNDVQGEIRDDLEAWGIEMKFGTLFVSFLWWGVSFTILVMFSWALPVWCANPVDNDFFDDEEDNSPHHNLVFSRRTTATYQPREEKYLAKEKIRKIQSDTSKLSKAKNRVSGLLGVKKNGKNNVSFSDQDDNLHYERNRLINEDNANMDENELDANEDEFGDILSNSGHSASSIVAGGSAELHHISPIFEEKNEEALRQLGRSLSRKSSVRHLNRNLSKSKTKISILESQSEEPLADNTAGIGRSGSQHSQQQTYDGYGHNKSQGPTQDLEVDNEFDYKEDDQVINQRNLLDILQTRQRRESVGSSFLNADEIELLDFNESIHKL
ncbi:hypothetical protein CLIB1423_07S01112 [[Candida] railenensis]|uniref:Ecm7p n=1 Tax=[Candida] railenensis TaxID=45579 RepID=A0A9P0VXH6_9ASCO|nr:hypothetical protein CLIB1423_07S01112 [[Candida] railenensis]